MRKPICPANIPLLLAAIVVAAAAGWLARGPRPPTARPSLPEASAEI